MSNTYNSNINKIFQLISSFSKSLNKQLVLKNRVNKDRDINYKQRAQTYSLLDKYIIKFVEQSAVTLTESFKRQRLNEIN